MRKIFLLVLPLVFLFVGCSSDDNPSGPPPEPTSPYAGNWRDSVKSASGLEYAIVAYNASGTKTSLTGEGYLEFKNSGSSSTTITRRLSPMGEVKNDSLYLTFESSGGRLFQCGGKLNSASGKVDGKLVMTFKSYPFMRDSTYTFNMSLKK
ncbi:MAG: hypothetical protein B6D45_03665 [Ignavibacteriales bacterium UTCHB3]|nr:MAG: hypothetical protein B6D45_03665 [Ignavibacteriales bacterium UTCHB3]